eukprot:CAMPEP_0196707174 /NCGR_PEP_ID=MMETSP1090-20130531/63518_1 /TAXON_ID=37098 /ORGANISM="Isochrysis sp, Strain CCMP1244" /LENGTH=57 /DNA_ID=CAMNT_0042047139 /DNA_START=85 /DNA_END=254 /DNA_ORIENTATION=-
MTAGTLRCAAHATSCLKAASDCLRSASSAESSRIHGDSLPTTSRHHAFESSTRSDRV